MLSILSLFIYLKCRQWKDCLYKYRLYYIESIIMKVQKFKLGSLFLQTIPPPPFMITYHMIDVPQLGLALEPVTCSWKLHLDYYVTAYASSWWWKTSSLSACKINCVRSKCNMLTNFNQWRAVQQKLLHNFYSAAKCPSLEAVSTSHHLFEPMISYGVNQ